MGCVSSTLLNRDDDFTQIGGSALGHHIVSLTSTTYGLLTLDPSPSPTLPPTPTPRFTLGSVFPIPLSQPRDSPEVINSWELMAGLDSTAESFRFSPLPPPQQSKPFPFRDKENSNPNKNPNFRTNPSSLTSSDAAVIPRSSSVSNEYSLDGFEKLCPPKGENKVVIYTTTLRGVRSTFEACNAVRAVMETLGVFVCERDISMDRGFREELRELMKGKEMREWVPPRVFLKGRYVGGAEEVMKIVEEGFLGQLLEGLPKLKAGYVCEGCGGVRFLPCFKCSGSCKLAMAVKQEKGEEKLGRTVVVKCSDCNENGLVLCPICS